MQQQEVAPKREEKTRMAAPKCATEKKFRHLCRTKSIDVKLLATDGRTTHSRINDISSRGSSGKRNERQCEKSHEFMKKKR